VKEVFILAMVLAALNYTLFIWLLKLRLPAWPVFMSH
jgi:hypothetical protein